MKVGGVKLTCYNSYFTVELFLQVFGRLGQNKKLGLSGRPMRPIGALGTSKVTIYM